MRVLLLSPWQNAWIPYFRDEVTKRGGTFALGKRWNGVSQHDVVIHGWASGDTQPVPGAKNVMFLRRYELFDNLGKVDWNGIDHLICVNTWIADRVRELFAKNAISVPVSVIYNGTNVDNWYFQSRTTGPKIGMACHVHPKKNLPLALQILSMLPEGYELHIAGEVQDGCTAEYLIHMSQLMGRKLALYGHVGSMNHWWEDKNYCLSTSLSEGNPNNVIEAMAKGIKPIIHEWPGASDQFPREWLFKTVGQACEQIEYETYESADYRDYVYERFSLANYGKVLDLCESLMEKETA